MKKFLIVAVAAALLLASTATANADITVWLGKFSGEDLLIEGTVAYGVAAGFTFARYFGVEVNFDYIPDSELPFNLEEYEDLLGVDVRVDLYGISGNVLLQYPFEDIVTPYFTIGYGVIGANARADLGGGDSHELWIRCEVQGGSMDLHQGRHAMVRPQPDGRRRHRRSSSRSCFESEAFENVSRRLLQLLNRLNKAESLERGDNLLALFFVHTGRF